MSIRVMRPGLLTSLQDLGRHGVQKYGVVASGAMDPFALRLANLLVGNEEAEAALEMTIQGPTLLFERDALIAICGAALSPKIDGRSVPEWRPVLVKGGSVLQFGMAIAGCRAYLAVAGGFDVPVVMGSRSTYLRAGIGGFQGRALKEGDVLRVRPASRRSLHRMRKLAKGMDSCPFAATDWAVTSDLLPAYGKNPVIRAMRGGQFDWFTVDSQERFFTEPFQVTPQSDRMGYRLSGARLRLAEPRELISEAVAAGTVQVPAGGQPIVLLADRQTTGGYPKIAQVASVDLPVIAQVKPGETVRFQEITLEEAQALYRRREREIELLKQGIALK
ncbi:5-oxoprolinase subunit C family protein [Effusibacillus pohliae]|uniref:5-oxoprolinase subunit C family protein n=1 Tax=Effusibacillus pohliae TaxID=232270 RepID=UPI00037FA553|nr:biotin-dependent carboxyltransferase family protein [Effusibacillus pohliae]